LIAIVIGVGAYKSGYLIQKNEDVSSVATPPVKQLNGHAPASVTNNDKQGFASLILTHFDNLKMQVFIDGIKEEPDTLSSLKVGLHKTFILRIQSEGKKHFIKEMKLENSTAVEVEIPEMPTAMYGYMNTGSACKEGEIIYEVFGEKRHTHLPMAQGTGIALPLQMDDKNKPIPEKFNIKFLKTGDTQEKNIEITVSREDQAIDLCEFL
jgi:serine/threonine-protein kinase